MSKKFLKPIPVDISGKTLVIQTAYGDRVSPEMIQKVGDEILDYDWCGCRSDTREIVGPSVVDEDSKKLLQELEEKLDDIVTGFKSWRFPQYQTEPPPPLIIFHGFDMYDLNFSKLVEVLNSLRKCEFCAIFGINHMAYMSEHDVFYIQLDDTSG